MPFGSIQLRPGVNTVATPTLNQGGISDSNLIRFRDGLPEKVGGWQKFSANPMGSITRDLHAWQDLNDNKWLAAGNLDSVKAMLGGGSLYDITPQTLVSDEALDVSITQGGTVVTIVDTGLSTLTVYDSVFFNTPISAGGLILAGSYQVKTVPTATSYTITAQSPATLTTTNAGTVPAFATVSGSPVVTVTLANHGLSDGDRFTFPISTTVGGVIIVGTYSLVDVTGANTFTITAATQATATTSGSMNGGAAQYLYSVTTGPSVSIGLPAWPLGALGQFALGQVFQIGGTTTGQTGTPITATDWSLDNWGEILLGCPRGGQIWYWSPSSGFTTMIPVGVGPQFSNGIFVAMPQQILVAWGSTASLRNSNDDANQDRLIVRWSDQLNFLEWRVRATTQAGSYRIPNGSEIRGGIQGAQQAYIFTDLDLWSMQYLGPPLVWGFNQIGTGCGLVGPHAVANLFGRTYWMGSNNFFVTTGQGVQPLPCTVWDTVFQDFDKDNQHKSVAGPNSSFTEMWFFYPSLSGGTGECDRYAKVNVSNGAWDTGALIRSAWIDESILGYPIGADSSTTYLQQHESGYDDDGMVMDSYLETGYTAVGDGENFSVIDYFEPDMKWKTVGGSTSAQVQFTLTAVPSPNGPTMTSGPITVSSASYYASPRLRGRQIKWRLETTDLGSWWRLGNTRYRYIIDGRQGG